MSEYSRQVTGRITSEKTYVTIPENSGKTVVLKCGDRSVEVRWCDLFDMIESAIAAWNRRMQ